MMDTPESFDLSALVRSITLPPLEPLDDWGSMPGLKSCGPFTIRGYWLGPYDHVEHDRRKARRIARRSGVRFTTRQGFKRRTYWFDFSEKRP